MDTTSYRHFAFAESSGLRLILALFVAENLSEIFVFLNGLWHAFLGLIKRRRHTNEVCTLT